MVISGRLGVEFSDGTEMEVGPDEVFDIPPGHNGWVIGDEPVVQIEWAGIRAFAGFPTGIHSRVLVTLLFTDIVDSTAIAARMGLTALARAPVEAFRGSARRARALSGAGGRHDRRRASREVRRACTCAALCRRDSACARDEGLLLRAAVHIGEVELVGRGVRGIAVHEAARIMGEAEGDEILVSETTRSSPARICASRIGSP